MCVFGDNCFKEIELFLYSTVNSKGFIFHLYVPPFIAMPSGTRQLAVAKPVAAYFSAAVNAVVEYMAIGWT